MKYMSKVSKRNELKEKRVLQKQSVILFKKNKNEDQQKQKANIVEAINSKVSKRNELKVKRVLQKQSVILFKKNKNEDQQKQKANIVEAINSKHFISRLVKSSTEFAESLDFSKVDRYKKEKEIKSCFLHSLIILE